MALVFCVEIEEGETGFIDKVDFFWVFIVLDTKARLGLYLLWVLLNFHIMNMGLVFELSNTIFGFLF